MVIGMATLFASGLTLADEFTGTLKKINDSDVIAVGYRETNIPFSYQDEAHNVKGYSQEYSDKIIAAVKQKLNKPNLTVKFVPITSPDRIPLLQNGVYDFECGSTTNNKERAQQVEFSDTIFIVGTRLLTAKDSNIKDFSDLKGQAVTTNAGTTSEVLLNKLNDTQNLGMRIVTSKEGGAPAFYTLQSGRAVAYMMDDALLAGDRSKGRDPKNWVIVGTPQSHEAYGCMMRKDDPQFSTLLNKTIADAQLSGEAAKWYGKWFKQPIPPKGINMNFDMSDEIKALFKHPNNNAL
ncbi:glutamate/aspartate ABC transporter substrate-binding protein [Acerihabitans arboris]|uniref:Glutamate/aspartate ABC transporter substrate-binding protein n=1 Tax=Acerihabitans arboris TaxID=2691583 RepID=A0A845SHN7_9GAMM|nr:glutamate/aspartate ABC transporter substrate-binding protein [Acerihabitans arboris]NDL62131.1 glutamate/aspartate ABC transporter substrate-binding protein [Acerihabitans arboris]